MRAVIVIIAIILSSCTAEWHIRKAAVKRGASEALNILIAEFPELTKRKQVVFDTVLIRHEGFDTIKVTKVKDSLIINNYGTITKVFRHYDTIRVLSVPRVDTVIKPIYIDKLVYSKPIKDWSNLFGWIVFGLIVFFIFGLTYKMMIK